MAGPTADELDALDELGQKGTWTLAGVDIAITNLDKVIVPARAMRRRSPSATSSATTRCSRRGCRRTCRDDRSTCTATRRRRQGGFWHKQVPAYAPEWVRRWPNPLADEGESKEYLGRRRRPGARLGANHAGLEIHPWTSTAANPEEPSYALDRHRPGTTTSWDDTLCSRVCTARRSITSASSPVRR
jgi:bifunctional non-homologous end joining protein LigD